MENLEIYVVVKKTYLNGELKNREFIAICDNKLDAVNHLVSCFVSLKGDYVVDYQNKIGDRIRFKRILDCGCLVGNLEEVVFNILFGKPNIRFSIYDYFGLSMLQKAMENLDLFKA